jgi:hypothetical protein
MCPTCEILQQLGSYHAAGGWNEAVMAVHVEVGVAGAIGRNDRAIMVTGRKKDCSDRGFVGRANGRDG